MKKQNKQFTFPEGDKLKIELEFPVGHVRMCTACEKGLVYVAEKIINGNDAEIKELCLCKNCRKILIKTVKETFEKG